MQAIMETIFESGYLLFALICGTYLVIKSNNNKATLLFGISLLLLGFGDGFHLVPRMYALNTDGIENNTYWLGIGKLITSITMTIFYVIIYIALQIKYNKKTPLWLNIVYSILFIARIVLVAMPQNEWTGKSPYSWIIIRNIPFILMGVIFICLAYDYAKKDKYLKWMWLLVILSFIFYMITTFGAPYVSILGLMMLPKTICYIIVFVLILLDNKKLKEDLHEENS